MHPIYTRAIEEEPPRQKRSSTNYKNKLKTATHNLDPQQSPTEKHNPYPTISQTNS